MTNRPPSGSPTQSGSSAPPIARMLEARERSFQLETTVTAMKKMEQELLSFVRTVPFRPLPRYDGVPEVPRPRSQVESQPPSHLYFRSALARCVLEKLASDLHGSEEESRELQVVAEKARAQWGMGCREMVIRPV